MAGTKLKNEVPLFSANAWLDSSFMKVIARLEENHAVYGNIINGINLDLGLYQIVSKRLFCWSILSSIE